MEIGRTTAYVVNEAEAARLAKAHGLPEIEVEAAFAGERVELAESVLGWIDDEERKLTATFGLIEGRKRYKPLRMLKSYARKYRTGRYRGTTGHSSR